MITLCTTWYNEEWLAPLFIDHYRTWVDEIVVFLDSDTDDDSANYLPSFDVQVIPFTNPHGWDCFLHAKRQQEFYKSVPSGHVLFVDSDEFVFPFVPSDEVEVVRFWQVFRNAAEGDIDRFAPAMYQRRHGVKETGRCPNSLYDKPCIIKAGLDVNWETVGHHKLFGTFREPTRFHIGTHWQMADPELAIARNVRNRVGRNSEVNKQVRAAFQFDEYTIEQMIDECEAHLHDPRIF